MKYSYASKGERLPIWINQLIPIYQFAEPQPVPFPIQWNPLLFWKNYGYPLIAHL